MDPLLARLKQHKALVADGAMGTMLFQRGLKPGECPERINLEAPEVLEEIAGMYLAAGAEILQTNTFGASPLKLSRYGLDARAEEVNSRAVAAVKKVAGDRAYVAASCGPCGRLLEPYGDATGETVYASFVTQMKTLVAGGVDMICIETMTDLTEAALAVKAAKSVSSSIPVCATMTFDPTPRGFFTIMGTGIEQAIEGLSRAGADIVGSNCGNGSLSMLQVAEQFARNSPLPISIRPNAGIPALRSGDPVYPESPEFMAEQSRELLVMGVKILGGCCGTTPSHIAAMRKVRDEFFSDILHNGGAHFT